MATVGGGASIPVLSTRLSERLQVPIFTAPQPLASAALGAAVLSQQQSSAGAPTAAAPVIETPTQMAPAAAPPTQAVPTATAAPAPLAWSEDADESDEPVPDTGGEHSRRICQGGSEIDDPADQRYADEARAAAVVQTHSAGPHRGRRPSGRAGGGGIGPVPLATKHQPGQHHPDQRAPAPSPQTVTITAPDNSTSTVSDPAAATPPHQQPAAGDDDLRAHHHGRAAADHDGPAAHDHPAPPTSQVTTTASPPTRERLFPLRPFEPPLET